MVLRVEVGPRDVPPQRLAPLPLPQADRFLLPTKTRMMKNGPSRRGTVAGEASHIHLFFPLPMAVELVSAMILHLRHDAVRVEPILEVLVQLLLVVVVVFANPRAQQRAVIPSQHPRPAALLHLVQPLRSAPVAPLARALQIEG